MITSKHHPNGTDRICEAYKKIRKDYQLIVDVQGDEPLISPRHIDKVINYNLKNKKNVDVVLPNLKIKATNNTNLVKIVSNSKNDVLYISRANIPHEFKNKLNILKNICRLFLLNQKP